MLKFTRGACPRLLAAMGLVLIALPGFAEAQAPGFDPFPGLTEGAYRFDLQRNLYPSPEAAAAERRELSARATAVVARSGKMTSAADVLAVLAEWDAIDRRAGRQYAYLSLRTAIDTRDAAAQASLSEFDEVIATATAQLQQAIATISQARWRALVDADPRLARYTYAVERLREGRAHLADSASERVLAEMEPVATSWGPALFQANLAATAGTIEVDGRTLDIRRNGNEIRNHPDRAVREKGFRLGQAGIASRRDVFALILTRQAAARNAIARLRKWPDYPSQAYAAGGLDRRSITGILDQLAASASINKRYEAKRNDEIRAGLGIDSVHTWDLTAQVGGGTTPRFTITEASSRVIAAAAPLGSAYVRELRALLDPANGRLDLIPRQNRVDRPGFSTGSVGYPSLFFQGRYEGYVDDLVILAHEAGHGVQNMLMDSAGVLPRYASGPNYFTESFAILSELLLLEHLSRSSSLASDRRYFQRRLIEDGLELYRFAHESRVELQVYDSVGAGRLLDADAIERLTQAVGRDFSIWFGPGSEREFAWVQPIQFYTRPMYRVNYVLAKLLALRYLDMLHQDPSRFTTRYGALLRNGYDAPPEALLDRFLGVSISNSATLVGAATRVLDEWVKDYVSR